MDFYVFNYLYLLLNFKFKNYNEYKIEDTVFSKNFIFVYNLINKIIFIFFLFFYHAFLSYFVFLELFECVCIFFYDDFFFEFKNHYIYNDEEFNKIMLEVIYRYQLEVGGNFLNEMFSERLNKQLFLAIAFENINEYFQCFCGGNFLNEIVLSSLNPKLEVEIKLNCFSNAFYTDIFCYIFNEDSKIFLHYIFFVFVLSFFVYIAFLSKSWIVVYFSIITFLIFFLFSIDIVFFSNIGDTFVKVPFDLLGDFLPLFVRADVFVNSYIRNCVKIFFLFIGILFLVYFLKQASKYNFPKTKPFHSVFFSDAFFFLGVLLYCSYYNELTFFFFVSYGSIVFSCYNIKKIDKILYKILENNDFMFNLVCIFYSFLLFSALIFYYDSNFFIKEIASTLIFIFCGDCFDFYFDVYFGFFCYLSPFLLTVVALVFCQDVFDLVFRKQDKAN